MPTGTLTTSTTNTTATEIPEPPRAVASEYNTETTGAAGRYWIEVYDFCRFAKTGIPLEMFLADPERILREQGQEGALESIRAGHLPLLPKQAEIARRLRDMGGM